VAPRKFSLFFPPFHRFFFLPVICLVGGIVPCNVVSFFSRGIFFSLPSCPRWTLTSSRFFLSLYYRRLWLAPWPLFSWLWFFFPHGGMFFYSFLWGQTFFFRSALYDLRGLLWSRFPFSFVARASRAPLLFSSGIL